MDKNPRHPSKQVPSEGPVVGPGTTAFDNGFVRFAERGPDNVWLTLYMTNGTVPLSLNIVQTDEGVSFDVYALGREDEQPLGSTWVIERATA